MLILEFGEKQAPPYKSYKAIQFGSVSSSVN